ncbi:hypothetical protein DFH06DRAFT_1338809 [Mycena polygramma]|nr:hypothetical protein DFH06DRAFT_1338809 [Mycena polygramma]
MPAGFSLDTILGALLLGTWVASILFGVVIVEACRLVTSLPTICNNCGEHVAVTIASRFVTASDTVSIGRRLPCAPPPRHRLLRRAIVLTVAVEDSDGQIFHYVPGRLVAAKRLRDFVLSLCATALAGDYGMTYYPTVTYWGNVEALGITMLLECTSLPLSSFVNTILATIVDSYLIYRLHTLMKNIWVTLFLYGLLILAMGGYLIVFILLVEGRNQQEIHIETIGAIVNFIAVAVVDLSTAAGLIWKLRTMKSNFAQTNTFLNRAMVGAVQTGSVTAVCSLLILATFVNNSQTDVSTFFLFQFAPLYTLTLLFNFNLRQAGRSATSKTSESRNGNTNIMLSEGIHVQRTHVVTMDPTDSVVDATHRRLDDLEEIKHNPNSSDVEEHSARNVMVKMKN